MELYAAMVENLDDHVGRLVEYLRVNGMYERTLIAFMSDNGANARDQFATGDSVDNSLDNLGAATSWVAPGPEWAEASTAPFSRYKQYTRQGGIVSPLIVSGPGVTARGSMDRSFVTVMDLAPTFIDLAGASYPTEDSIVPMRGESVLGLLRGEQSHVHDDEYTTVLMHAGRALVRQGDWKLVTLEGPFDESKFELFNVASDPGETTNLAPDHPDRFEAMLGLWRTERRELGIVLPGDP